MLTNEDLRKQSNEHKNNSKFNPTSWNYEDIKNILEMNLDFTQTKNDKNIFNSLNINDYLPKFQDKESISMINDNDDDILMKELENTGDKSEKLNERKCCRWTKEEDDLLIALVEEFEGKSWKKISSFIKNRSPIQCLHRWTKILKPGLVKGPWTAEEDNILISWVKKNGTANFINCNNIIPGRNSKQCRERWINVLNPKVLKGEWSLKEDYLIFKLFVSFGGKWIKFVPFFNGIRAENSIKNRFYSTIRRFNTILKKQKKDNSLSEKEKVDVIFSNLRQKIMEDFNLKTDEEIEHFEYNDLGFCDTLEEKDPIKNYYSKNNIIEIAQKYIDEKDRKIIEKNKKHFPSLANNYNKEFPKGAILNYNEAKLELTKKRECLKQLGEIITKKDEMNASKPEKEKKTHKVHNYNNDFAISVTGSLESNLFSSNMNSISGKHTPNSIPADYEAEKKEAYLGTNQNYSNMNLEELENKILNYCQNNELNINDDWNNDFNSQINNVVSLLDTNYHKFMNNNYNQPKNEKTGFNQNTTTFTNLDTRHETKMDFHEIENDIENTKIPFKCLISESEKHEKKSTEKSNFNKLLSQLNELEDLIKMTKSKINNETEKGSNHESSLPAIEEDCDKILQTAQSTFQNIISTD